MDEPRSTRERRAHAVAVLEARDGDAWVATSSAQGPHLVPLSYAWTGAHLVLATEARSVTVANLRASARARIALGGSRDVVMVEAVLEEELPVVHGPGPVADRYAAQADWDPRDAGDGFVFLLLRPRRVQVWREANEIDGRTVMRDGSWVD